ncbi:MAG: putative glycosyltransferase [Gallionellaceae bacterium]|nr:MAG: putative glycosyltransferase [Gallionellaceae bacterium]
MSSRIAYIINQYPKVSHTFIRREILALEHQGFEILRIAHRGWDAELADDEDKQERIKTRYILQDGFLAVLWAVVRTALTTPGRFLSAFALAAKLSGKRGERALPYHLAYLAEACRILPWLKSFGATHLHAHFGTNSTEVALLAHVLGGPPYSFTFHSEQESLFDGIGEKVSHAAFVVAISSFSRGQIYNLVNPAHWPKVKVVHCGLEPAFFSCTPVPVPIEPLFICVGRLSAKKAHTLLIEAAHELAYKGIEFKLVLAGDGEIRAELEELIARYGLTKQIRITGWISSEQVREEMLAARALVLPSFSEGLPVVIMEAMSLRRPVLATYVAGIPELVLSGENGWLFPAGSVDSIANAIEECLSAPLDELQRMGDAGYLRVMERHSIDTEAAKLAALFRASDASR